MLYFVTPAPGMFPGISRLFDETIHALGAEVPSQHIYLDTCVATPKPEDIVIFGAWHPQYAIPLRRCQAQTKLVEFSSPLLQQELTQVESHYFMTILDLLRKKVIQGVWLVDRDNYELFGTVDDNVLYTPHPFDPAPYLTHAHQSDERSDVAFFTVFTNRQKNVLTQLAAARIAQNDVEFSLYVNGLPEPYQQFARTIGLKYRDLQWLPREDYCTWLGSMRLLMQVSLSEAFSYVAAESLALGTPVLMSPVVAHNMGIALRIYDSSSVTEIANAITCLLQMAEDAYCEYSTACQQIVTERAAESNAVVRRVFADMVS